MRKKLIAGFALGTACIAASAPAQAPEPEPEPYSLAAQRAKMARSAMPCWCGSKATAIMREPGRSSTVTAVSIRRRGR